MRTGVGAAVGAAVALGAVVGVAVAAGDGVDVGVALELAFGDGEGFGVFAGVALAFGDGDSVGASVGDAVGDGAIFAVVVVCFFGAFAKRASAIPKNHPAMTTTTAAAIVIAQPLPPPDERRGPDGVSRRRRPRSSSFIWCKSLSPEAGSSSKLREDVARDYGARARRSSRSCPKRLRGVRIGHSAALVSSARACGARSNRGACAPRTFLTQFTRDDRGTDRGKIYRRRRRPHVRASR